MPTSDEAKGFIAIGERFAGHETKSTGAVLVAIPLGASIALIAGSTTAVLK
jgi:hypothetical protein